MIHLSPTLFASTPPVGERVMWVKWATFAGRPGKVTSRPCWDEAVNRQADGQWSIGRGVTRLGGTSLGGAMLYVPSNNCPAPPTPRGWMYPQLTTFGSACVETEEMGGGGGGTLVQGMFLGDFSFSDLAR